MLRDINLKRTVEKNEYRTRISELQLELGHCQREARARGIPIIIVFDGWDTAGKGELINELILALDPRGFSLYSPIKNNETDSSRPYLYQFWTKTPRNGLISLYEKSWYHQLILAKLNKTEDKRLPEYDDLISFERQLADAGNIIVKLFLHISKKEQQKRIEKLKDSPDTAWVVDKAMEKRHKNYEKLENLYDQMIELTDSDFAAWSIIEATDQRFAKLKIFSTIIAAVQRKLAQPTGTTPSLTISAETSSGNLNSSILERINLTECVLSREEYREKLEDNQKQLRQLQFKMASSKNPGIILYEGWDAAGKGGNIKRLVQAMDPRNYQVVPIAAPDSVEKAHHYLWRFWNHIPHDGFISILDRSWYGRVLVERVEGFCSESEWRRSFREINEMEKQLTDYGMLLVKFWLHVDPETQLMRFEERMQTPDKQWKITDEDWRNREKWSAYQDAVEEMLFRTSTSYAPWTVVESNDKLYARIKSQETVIKEMRSLLARRD